MNLQDDGSFFRSALLLLMGFELFNILFVRLSEHPRMHLEMGHFSFFLQVLELQQQLKNAQHQLRVEEARAGESSRLERDSRDLFDSLSALRAQQQEGHITR